MIDEVDTQQLITLIFGILTAILTVVVIFQTRIGKLFASLKYDIQSMEGRLGARIDEVKTDLKEDIHTVKTDLKQDIHTVKIDLKQDIHNAEVRLNGNETELNPEERTEAEAV